MKIWKGKIQTQSGFSLLPFWKILALLVFLSYSVAAPGKWSISQASESDDVVVAEGTGFKLTEGDVNKVKAYYDKTPIRTTEAEYHQAAFKIKLFAHDAVFRQLDKGLDISPEEVDTVESWMKLADVCYKKVVEEYPVSDLAIESYYRAFPERFKDKDEADSGTDQKTIDAETRKRIRDTIINAKSIAILSDTIHLLINKYGIKFVGTYTALEL
jgi:hypothetical protein